MSKYNDFMSHIRVDDAMHRRIMDAVSGAIEQGTEITPLNNVKEEDRVKTPIKRKAKVSVIKIISIAAAAVLVVGGAVILSTRTMGTTKSMNEVAMETRAMEVDSAMRLDGENRNLTNNKNASFSAGSAGKKNIDGTVINRAADGKKQEETIEGNEESDIKTYAPGSAPSEAPTEAEDDDVKKGDIKDSLPFKVKTVGSGSLKGNIAMTVYTGEKGEKMILFKAPEGTNIVKAYYPDFKGVPALLQTEAGQVFKAVDTSAGRNVVVKNAGPFDAVTWTKDGSSYMIAFSKKTDTHVFISLMETI